LRGEGHDVWHGIEHGQHRMSDRELFQLAAADSRIVVTFDLDFGEILTMSGGLVSVITLRLRLRSNAVVIARLSAVLESVGHLLAEGPAIVIVEDGRHRFRRLPGSVETADD
jgi:predicted nuclease of predicted toxin-antitoxin system